MLFIHGEQRFFFFMGVLLLLIPLNTTQTIENQFRPSNIELTPSFVITNSTSVVTFLCINHQANDDLPLIINLSKNISKDQLRIFRYPRNKTTIHIRIQLKNYLGIFHLFCYTKNQKNQRTRADVIVKSEPGLVKLAKRCRVYEREYIKCIVRAPVIARAIQNDFPANFEFMENTIRPAYNPHYEFLKNESTMEDLVFKWTPNVDGEFPNGIRMNMYIRLLYFSPLFYGFDMTPIFVIKPNFTLKNLSKNRIEIQLTSIFPLPICKRSITPTTNSNHTQTWRKMDSTRNTIIIKNLSFDTPYQICLRCRQTSSDPYGTKECQEIRTSKKSYLTFNIIISILLIIIFCSILIFIAALICLFHRHRRVDEPEQPVPDEVIVINPADQDRYTAVEQEDLQTTSEPQTPSN